MSTSPDAEHVREGPCGRDREDVGQGSQSRVGEDDAVRVCAGTVEAGLRERHRVGRHRATVGGDGGEIRDRPERDDGHSGHADIAEDRDEHGQGREDVERRTKCSREGKPGLAEQRDLDRPGRRPRARPSGSGSRTSPPSRPRTAYPARIPAGIAQSMNIGWRPLASAGRGEDLAQLRHMALGVPNEEWLGHLPDRHLAARRVQADSGRVRLAQLAERASRRAPRPPRSGRTARGVARSDRAR